MKSLLITLGHNSSAIYIETNAETGEQSKPIGYEEERLNKIKSSSAFPKLAIERIIEQVDIAGATVYISHWFDDFEKALTTDSKYFDFQYMVKLAAKYDLKIIGLSKNFTHHDAHAYSAEAFFMDHATEEQIEKQRHVLVVDGFGNNKEVISLYKTTGREPLVLVKRLYGYENSLGLMYQFATAFTEMKENQDEYKFLGYESDIEFVLDPEKNQSAIQAIRIYADMIATDIEVMFATFGTTETNDATPDAGGFVINSDELRSARAAWYSIFEKAIEMAELSGRKLTLRERRVVIGYFVQRIIEQAVSSILMRENVKNVLLAGGCFYNVKLNHRIMRIVPGFTSVMPLCGDQGAAIGMYQAMGGKFKFYDLCYGVRPEIYDIDKSVLANDKIAICNSDVEFATIVSHLLNSDRIVNIVSGNMEFGPRALCRTTTLALPTSENVEYINMLNGRNTVMPMAPVVTDEAARELFYGNHLDKVVGSNHYMIITHEFKFMNESIRGVGHPMPLHRQGYTGRPQIIKSESNEPIALVLDRIKDVYGRDQVLINTSFNTHGTPILYSYDDVVSDFKKQRVLDTEDRVRLVILDWAK